MTLRLMCDSDNLNDLIGTPVIATYADLVQQNSVYTDLLHRFPDSELIFGLRGEADPLGLASWVDYENSDYTPAQLRNIVAGMNDRKVPYPTVYSDLSNVPAVKDACDGLSYFHWIAWWGHIQVPAYPDAVVQFASAGSLGAHLDLSLISNDKWMPGYETPPWLAGITDTLGQQIDALRQTENSIRHHLQ